MRRLSNFSAETFAALRENTKHYPNIKAFNAGLGDVEGKVPFVVGTYSGENYIGADGKISVDIQTIDSLNMEVNFIKMDTEGYEGNIIRGAQETIKVWRPTIVMSAYHRPEDPAELPKLVNAAAAYSCKLYADVKRILFVPLPKTSGLTDA